MSEKSRNAGEFWGSPHGHEEEKLGEKREISSLKTSGLLKTCMKIGKGYATQAKGFLSYGGEKVFVWRGSRGTMNKRNQLTAFTVLRSREKPIQCPSEDKCGETIQKEKDR